MFVIEHFHKPCAVAYSDLTMPVGVLQTLPDYVKQVDTVFNVPAALNRLLHGTRTFVTSVWAPDWSENDLASFGLPPRIDRGERFGFWEKGSAFVQREQKCHILHVVGKPDETGDKAQVLVMSAERQLGIRPDQLELAVTMLGTRLLILDMPPGIRDPRFLDPVVRWARHIAGQGGPAIAVVWGRDRDLRTQFLMDFYANIIHNWPLSEAARPGVDAAPDDLYVALFLARGANQALQFERLILRLLDSHERLQKGLGQLEERQRTLESQLPFLHRTQAEELRWSMGRRIPGIDSIRSKLDAAAKNLHQASLLPWHHERKGVIPLWEAVEQMNAVPSMIEETAEEISVLAPQFERQVEESASRAARVLNATFQDPVSGRTVTSRRGLVVGADYDFLVDIGPQWDKLRSLVVGHEAFPVRALPPGVKGHRLQVVLISQDFEPRVVTSELWLPAGTGRSFPWMGDGPAEKAGPVALRIRVPDSGLPEGRQVARARGRLFIYHANNLLQSAVVAVGVTREGGGRLTSENVVRVDYTLSEGFQDVTPLSRRSAALLPGGKDGVPVTLNIALNDNGDGGHRIAVKTGDTSDVAWMPYDPLGARTTLEEARKALLDCYWKSYDASGRPIQPSGNKPFALTGTNGKSLVDFKGDLLGLATLGSQLFNMVFTQVKPSRSNQTNLEWVSELRKTLAKTAVIQVARTGSTGYVFPWSLVYDIPLLASSSAGYRYCPVIGEEWSPAGVRVAGDSGSCPHAEEAYHRQDVLCPYGLWGLRHIIEQPLSPVSESGGPPKERVRILSAGREIELSVAVTRDSALDGKSVDGHVKNLEAVPRVKLSPITPADDWPSVQKILEAPSVVYFLCHGEYDQARRQAYLGVGPKDSDPDHRVYMNPLASFLGSRPPGVWKEKRPLVMINGCHTCDLEPGQVLSFAAAFAAAGACGVVGTEVSVVLPVAIEVGERLVGMLAGRVPLGKALRDVRWEFVNKGNLLGLAYTVYSLADLAIIPKEDPEPVASRAAAADSG